jgi:hypothetical protein
MVTTYWRRRDRGLVGGIATVLALVTVLAGGLNDRSRLYGGAAALVVLAVAILAAVVALVVSMLPGALPRGLRWGVGAPALVIAVAVGVLGVGDLATARDSAETTGGCLACVGAIALAVVAVEAGRRGRPAKARP